MRSHSTLQLISLTLLSFVLTACGGKGSGRADDSGEPEEQQRTDSSDPSTERLVSQSIKVNRPSSLDANETLTLINSDLYLEKDLTGAPEEDLVRRDKDETLLLLDTDDNLQFVGFVSEGSNNIEANPVATAAFLLGIHPGIAGTFSSNPMAFCRSVKGLEEVQELANLVDSTAEWFDIESGQLVEVYNETAIKWCCTYYLNSGAKG